MTASAIDSHTPHLQTIRPFVITGCGRSGTTYTAKLLSLLGCSCTHEQYFTGSKPSMARGTMARLGLRKLAWCPTIGGEAAWEAAPWLPLMADDTLVFHQLRHPLEFIRSRQKKGWVHGRFRSRHLPHIPKMDKASFAALPLNEQANWLARFWIDWNALVETRAASKQYYRYRIEDFDLPQLLAMLQRIHFPHEPASVKETFESLPRNVNTRGEKRSDITLDLLSGELRQELTLAAARYGYTL